MKRWVNPKGKAKALLRRFGYDLVRSQPRLVDFLKSRNIDLVLDVGANVGQFGLSLRDSGFRGEILSFEPIKSVFSNLERVVQSEERWQARNLALGATTGRAVINVSEDPVFSSLLQQTAAAEEYYSPARVERREEIEVARLDEVFPPFRDRNVFLKIDTQGFERQVLDGGVVSLNFVKGALLELPIVHFYENTWSFGEALEYMRERNFVLSQVRPTNFLAVDPVSVVEVDCIFRRNDG